MQALLDSPRAKEADFHAFFERHPHFLRRWDYREVYSHVSLARLEGELIPDFVLTDRELQRAGILELKLPGPKLIQRQQNRDRFTSAVLEARTQLLRYRDWFRDRHNRLSLKQRIGMEVYEPHLMVIIGRASEFQDEFGCISRHLLLVQACIGGTRPRAPDSNAASTPWFAQIGAKILRGYSLAATRRSTPGY